MLPKVNSLLWSAAKNKSFWLSIFTGLCLALAFPPLPFAFWLLVGFVPLLVLIEVNYVGEAAKGYFSLFKRTYVAFFFWNLFTCYWLMFTALSVGDRTEAVLAFIAGLLATVCNAALMSIPFQLYLFTRRRLPRTWALVAWGAYWLSFEYLHLRWDLTWSWLNLGHGFTHYPFYIQFAEFTGVPGITALALAANIVAFEWLYRAHNGLPARRIQYGLMGIIGLPLLLYPIIMNKSRAVFQAVGEVGVRVIQPNVDPYNKFNVLPDEEQMAEFLRLMQSKPLDGTTLIILPETAIPRSIEIPAMQGHPLLAAYREFVHQYPKTDILSGLVAINFYDKRKEKIPASAEEYIIQTPHGIDTLYYDFFNAAALWGASDSRVYKKAKLVPFTERTPFLESLTFLKSWHIDLGGGFGSYGLPDSIFALQLDAGYGIAPIICYESQFGDFVRKVMNDNAQIGCIITNDGWFGKSSGHLQHAGFTVLRAIETRRDFARSANTGRSLFCDNTGTIHEYIGWWEKGVIDRKLKRYNTTTFYMQYGDWLSIIGLIGGTGLFLAAIIRKNKKSIPN